MAEEWLRAKRDRRPSTLSQWEAHLHKHILPVLGAVRLDQITVANVERFRDDRRRAGLSPQTVNKLLTTIAAIFKFANRKELIDRNPAGIAERLRVGSSEMIDGEGEGRPHQEVSSDEVLSPEQAGQLVAAAEPGLYQTLFLTALVSGARIGELTALAWADVDLAGRTLAIRRNLSWASTRAEGKGLRPRFFEPKTRASRRTLRLPTELVSALKRWKLACPLGRFGLVFPDAAGDPLHRKRVYARGLLPALKKAKLPHVTIHSLRHSFASALIMQGAPVTEVASLLGHSSPTVTLNVYSHWLQRVRTTSVETLARTVVAGISNEVGSKTVAA